MITCLHPRIIYNKYIGKHISVPCGKCEACRSLKVNEWSNRCELELSSHRYCYFGTLTYIDSTYPRFDVRQLYGMGDEDFDRLYDESLDFLEYWNFNIRLIDYRDIQLFFKHLRNEIFKEFKERIPFSYFVACEYGSTTFHPHYHLLLYFDSDSLYRTIKKLIYKAWFFKNPNPSFSQFFKFNRWERVRSTASSYVAGYLNSSENLPPILTYDSFRTKHQCSKSSPFGLAGVKSESLQEFQFGNPVKVSFKRPTNNRVVDISLWRSVESRFFPRCLGFSLLSDSERMSLYQLSRRYGHVQDFVEFAKRFLSEWIFIPPTNNSWRMFFALTGDEKEANCRLQNFRFPYNVEKLRKAFYLSKRFLEQSEKIGSEQFLYARIKEYYARKDYNCLCSQLQQEEELTSLRDGHKYLPFIPFIIDGLFYENKRFLPLSTRAHYIEQFNIVGDFSQYSFERSSLYRDRYYIFSKIVRDNVKVKVKKDYLAQHPEYANIYKNIISKSLII